MKKILVASTALVAAGMITAGSASASEKIKLGLGGFSKWWVVGAWQDDSFERATNNGTAGQGNANSVDVKGDNEIWFSGSTKLDNGLEVGINIELEAGGGQEAGGGGSTDVIDKSYVYVAGGFGKVIVGTESNGTVLMHTMAPDAAGNTGSEGVITGGRAIARPAAITGFTTTEIDTDAEADKITYVAPSFYGFTVGGSYVPNATEDNAGVNNTAAANAASEIYGIAAMYAGTVYGVGVKASAGWVTYDINQATQRSQEVSAGAQLSYAGFTLGGSYRDIQDNLNNNITAGANAATQTSNTGYVWDIGLQYETGPYAISLVYLNAVAEGLINTQGEDEMTAYQVSGKYNMGAGVDVLATVGWVEYDDETAKTSNGDANHNEGWSVMTGLSLQF